MLNFIFDVIILIVMDVIFASIKKCYEGIKWVFKSIKR